MNLLTVAVPTRLSCHALPCVPLPTNAWRTLGCTVPARAQVAFGRYNRFCAKYVQELTFRNSTRRLPCVRDFLHGLSLQHQDVLDVGVFDEDGRAFVPIEGQTQYKWVCACCAGRRQGEGGGGRHDSRGGPTWSKGASDVGWI